MARLKTVERNSTWLTVMLNGFTEERGRDSFVATPAQIEVDGLAFGVHGAVKLYPAAANLNVGLIGPPRSSYGSFVATPPLLKFVGIPDCPPQNGRVRNRKPTLAHHFYQVAVAELVAKIPPQAPNDDFVLEPAAVKQ